MLQIFSLIRSMFSYLVFHFQNSLQGYFALSHVLHFFSYACILYHCCGIPATPAGELDSHWINLHLLIITTQYQHHINFSFAFFYFVDIQWFQTRCTALCDLCHFTRRNNSWKWQSFFDRLCSRQDYSDTSSRVRISGLRASSRWSNE
jgi:hypothetical protein